MATTSKVYAQSKTHEMLFVLPKPPSDEISRLIAQYFDLQSKQYDEFDKNSEKRTKYTESVNKILAEDITQLAPGVNFVSIGCGTGRREKQIEGLLGKKLTVQGIEVSKEMAAECEKKGISCAVGNWPHMDLGNISKKFDVALYLYSFGMLVDEASRNLAMKHIKSLLRPGGVFYIDTFNLDDQTEWGPQIRSAFRQENAGKHGYVEGEFFYRLIGGDALSFCYYSDETKMKAMLHKAGFKITKTWYIGYSDGPGELHSGPENSALLFRVEHA